MQESINIGAFENDPAADSIRVAYGKCNQNFTELYEGGSGTGTVTSVAVSVPTGFVSSGGPITTSGTIAITTALSGIIKGTGTGLIPAVAGTDYLAPNGSGTGLTGVLLFVNPPTSETDFSTLPGGVAPTTGGYSAMEGNIFWTIKGGETSWQQIPRSN